MDSPRPTLALALVALFAMAQIAQAAVWIEKVVENPMYPRHCRDRIVQKYFPDNAEWYDRQSCLQMTCEFPYIRTFSCPLASVEPPCTMVVDNTKRYPDCCPQPVCPTFINSDTDSADSEYNLI